MINHEHKFLFVHIPRTSGTSIETQFQYDEKKEGNKHWNLNDWKNYLDSDTFESYFKFAFVRNPWDIVISKYFDRGWYSSPVHGRGGQIGYYSRRSLKFFLEHYQPAAHEHGDGLLDYFDPEQMYFIGRFENRAQDLEYICKKIGININKNRAARSRKCKKHHARYYDDETRKIVAEKYAKDIEHFGYKFGE